MGVGRVSGNGRQEISSKFPGNLLGISRNRGCVWDLQNDTVCIV